MFTGSELTSCLESASFSHVIWIPDTTLGKWERELSSSKKLSLLRVCREGETWPLAAGLYLGGQRPIVLMQTTGLFESGDALRNVVYDLGIPVLGIIGARNWSNPNSTDSARRFAAPILNAWGVDCFWIEHAQDKSRLASFFEQCRSKNRAGFAVLAED